MTEGPRTPPEESPRLRLMPVVLFSDVDLAPLVLAGAARAGRDPKTVELAGIDRPSLAASVTGHAEIAVAILPAAELIAALNLVRELGGRPLPVLGLRTRSQAPHLDAAGSALLNDPALRDLNIPVPAIGEDGTRRAVWDQLRSAALEDRHHLVEVDGAPALEELAARGLHPPDDRWRAVCAGAAGVLAGRLSAGNRRWRDPSEG
jgi:hypothetical protein